MARINKTRFAILGFLMLQPMSGYDMKKFMMKSTNHFWMESDGQLYPILHKLISEGKIVSKEENNGARKKNVYSITDLGKEEFLSWMSQPPEPPVKRIEFSLKLFFGEFVDPEILIKHIEKEIQQAKNQLEIIEAGSKELDLEYKDHPSYNYWKILSRRGEINAKALLDWSNEAIHDLKKLNKK